MKHQSDSTGAPLAPSLTSPMNRAAQILIALDGRPHYVPTGCTLAELVDSVGHAAKDVGTAVNGSFVARDARTRRVLNEGDAVLLFQPIVGG
ncbi:hypothetical protein BH09PSE5_BH09PSE5_25920 [soil metagenome]